MNACETMTRTEQLMNKGLSADEALKVVIFADQGLRWIKRVDAYKHQESMDNFIDQICSKQNRSVKQFSKHLTDNYFAKRDEDVIKNEFERRWSTAQNLLKIQLI